MDKKICIGRVITGGYDNHLMIELHLPPESLRIGDYLVIEGQFSDFFAAVVDLKYGPAELELVSGMGEVDGRSDVKAYVSECVLSCQAEVALMMAVPRFQIETTDLPVIAATIPPQCSAVRLASAQDLDRIFGKPSENSVVIGHTLNQNHPINLDISHLTQRSIGIFGATGTGKSFLVRNLLDGLHRQRVANVLVLDMHDEYGYPDVDEANNTVPSLAEVFPDQVAVVGLGSNTRIRGHIPPRTLKIAYSDLTTDDILMMENALDLTSTSGTILDSLVRSFGDTGWLAAFARLENSPDAPKERSLDEWAKRSGLQVHAARALRRRINRLLNRSYVVENPGGDSINALISMLENGKSIVLSFGRYKSDVDRLLVGNIIARRLSERWTALADGYRSGTGDAPGHLVIVVEEGHLFLQGAIANQSAFGGIARQMRKSYCTLIVVDQRPKLEEDVLTQLGTRFISWLGSDDDVKRATAGLPNRENLRQMIASLRQSRECVITGWGTPLPIAFRPRLYNQALIDRFGDQSRVQD